MFLSSTGGRRPRREAYLLFAAFLVTALFPVACSAGEEDSTKPTIRLHDALSESQRVNNAIAKYIIEEGYGYPVETVVETTPTMMEALPTGEIDANLEGWQQNIVAWYNEETAKGTILNLGMIYEASSQVFVIPSWVSEEYGIGSVFDMKDHWELFIDPQDPSKGVFYNCIAGWECANINQAKLDAYGLSKYYNAVSPASATALDAALAEPQRARGPVFGYYWTPAPLMVTYDWYALVEPPHSQECWRQLLRASESDGGLPAVEACAYESIPIEKLVHAGLREKAPDVFAMIERLMVGLAPLNTTMAWAIQNAIEDWEKAAVYYLRNYEERWRTWVTPDAYDKINAALKKAG